MSRSAIRGSSFTRRLIPPSLMLRMRRIALGAAVCRVAAAIRSRTCNTSPAALVHVEVPRGEGFVGVS